MVLPTILCSILHYCVYLDNRMRLQKPTFRPTRPVVSDFIKNFTCLITRSNKYARAPLKFGCFACCTPDLTISSTKVQKVHDVKVGLQIHSFCDVTLHCYFYIVTLIALGKQSPYLTSSKLSFNSVPSLLCLSCQISFISNICYSILANTNGKLPVASPWMSVLEFPVPPLKRPMWPKFSTLWLSRYTSSSDRIPFLYLNYRLDLP